MIVRYVPQTSEVVEAVRIFREIDPRASGATRTKTARTALAILAIALAFVEISWIHLSRTVDNGVAIVATVFAFVMMIPELADLRLRLRTPKQVEVVAEIDESGVRVTAPVTWNHPWAEITRWGEGPTVFLLCHAPDTRADGGPHLIILPKRAVPERELESLRALLAERMPPHSEPAA